VAIFIYAVPILLVAAFATVLSAVMQLFDGPIAKNVGYDKVAKVEPFVYGFLTYVAFVLLVLYGMWLSTGIGQ
jgi:cellobiose-specific phosphotransferase system component IIC